MEQSRRDFIKVIGKVTAGLGLTSLVGVQSSLTSGVQTASACLGSGAIDWGQVRSKYFNLSTDYIYMNNSTMGATLVPVSDRMQEVQQIFSQGCTIDTFNSEIVMTALPQLREEMRQLVNADLYYAYPGAAATPGKCVGNVDSVTEGMSFVANGLDLGSRSSRSRRLEIKNTSPDSVLAMCFLLAVIQESPRGSLRRDNAEY